MENWFSLLEGRGIYGSGEVARVSGVKFVWLCTIGQGRGVEQYLIFIHKDCRIWEERSYMADKGAKPDNRQGNKFLLGLMVGELDSQ